MHKNFKNIHMGRLIGRYMQECGIDVQRAASFLKVDEEELEQMYTRKSLDCETLLRWSKLLKYDFFRIYSQHLILYSPQDANITRRKKEVKSGLPDFKKNIYTEEVILYLVELVTNGKMTYKQIQTEYNIPSSTVLRWKHKYGKPEDEKIDDTPPNENIVKHNIS